MKFLLLGAVSGLDVLVNVFVFSGALRAQFDVTEAAEFSTVLAWSVVLSAILFGGAEQVVDHKRNLPENLFASPRTVAYACLVACAALLLITRARVAIDLSAVVLLAAVGGLRSVGRAVAYARDRYTVEAAISLFELGLIVALTLMELSILAAYLCSRLGGLVLRIPALVGFPSARQTSLDMWSYTFAAIAPALYFNIYYAVLPSVVSADVVVRFRLVQSALVPMSFLGSLIARARILFRGNFVQLLPFFQASARGISVRQLAVSAVLPAAVAFAYIAALALTIVPLRPVEFVWMVLYCALIYHRAQLYSSLTLEIGPAGRARVALLGILLVAVSIAPIAAIAAPTIAALYAALAAVEATLVVISVLTLRRAPVRAIT